MNTTEHKVLACVDLSPYAQHVADYAAWAAARLSAPLELLHVIDHHPALEGAQDHSGALTANAEENLLKTLAEQDALRTRTEREVARTFLQTLRERALALGAAQVDTRQRHGDLEETLAEQQSGARLLVLGRQGASASKGTALGRHVEWTVRSIQRPILAVNDTFRAPERVMIAFDGSAITRKGVEMVAHSPLFKGFPIHVLMSGAAKADAAQQMAWAQSTLEQAGLTVHAQVQAGEPLATITQAIQDQHIDLLIMGAYTHSPLRKLFFGSKTDELLRQVRVPTLLLR